MQLLAGGSRCRNWAHAVAQNQPSKASARLPPPRRRTSIELLASVALRRYGDSRRLVPTEPLFLSCFRRESCPLPGDRVQVQWSGAFNLFYKGAIRKYEGRAWWDASIVQYNKTDSTFLVHYPSWDSDTWDEWVPCTRLRWPSSVERLKWAHTAPNHGRHPLSIQSIQKGDAVEVHCPSSLGASPWLETKVDTVHELPSPQPPEEANPDDSHSPPRAKPCTYLYTCTEGIIDGPTLFSSRSIHPSWRSRHPGVADESCAFLATPWWACCCTTAAHDISRLEESGIAGPYAIASG